MYVFMLISSGVSFILRHIDSRRRRGRNNTAIAIVTVTMYTLSTLSSASYWFQNRDHFIVDLAVSLETGEKFALKVDKNALWAFFSKTLAFSINILIADCLLVSLLVSRRKSRLLSGT